MIILTIKKGLLCGEMLWKKGWFEHIVTFYRILVTPKLEMLLKSDGLKKQWILHLSALISF
jgi:hypothetical protein